MTGFRLNAKTVCPAEAPVAIPGGLVSLCPYVFTYDPPGPENDQWSGTLTLTSESGLSGIYSRLSFDKPPLEVTVSRFGLFNPLLFFYVFSFQYISIFSFIDQAFYIEPSAFPGTLKRSRRVASIVLCGGEYLKKVGLKKGKGLEKLVTYYIHF